MGWTRRAVVGLVSAAVIAAPADAFAIVLAPPGKSGADQYFETVPTSAGNAAPPAGGSASPGQSLAGIGQGGAGARTLARLGADGQAAAGLAAATSPTPPGHAGANAGNGSGSRRTASSPSGASSQGSANGSATGGLVDTLTGSDSGGIGLVLPLLMLVSLLGAIALGFGLRRRSTPG